MGAEKDRSQQTYEEAEQARPPKTRGKGVGRYEIPDELVQQAMEILERDFPGAIASMKEIMRDGFEHWDEYEEKATENGRRLSNICRKFRFIVEHDDPYWARSDLIHRIKSYISDQIDEEDKNKNNYYLEVML
ncbi:hypothetical protein [Brucella intermedia]|uniref:hypothetical protein n=1 Tax=Brucella intermedia TaxID=94625 RepID=UPI0004696A72|nr:hypothetical protein [Brucella intermedia]